MDPRIQYCTTSDGVSIAYWTVGAGPPLVHLPPMLPFSHIQREWQNPDFGRWYKRLAQRTTLVRYDARGTGMSQREGVSFSLEAFMLDVQAVIDHLGLDRFALLGFLHSGLVAIPYAIRHPEQVSHLVLWCSHGPLTEYASSRREALHSLIDRDWELFTETIAHTRLGWSGEGAHEVAAYLRESLTPDECHLAYSAVHELEVMTLLPQLKPPTLVLHRRELPVVKVSVAMDLASGIPKAQLIVLEGASAAPYLDDMEDIAGSIEEFLGITGETRVQAVPFRTVLFTDLVGHTENDAAPRRREGPRRPARARADHARSAEGERRR
jgi:pimeloyl-ACP methyl ester carboxylesterase